MSLRCDEFELQVLHQLDAALQSDLITKQLFNELCYAVKWIVPPRQSSFIKKLNDKIPGASFTLDMNSNVQPSSLAAYIAIEANSSDRAFCAAAVSTTLVLPVSPNTMSNAPSPATAALTTCSISEPPPADPTLRTFTFGRHQSTYPHTAVPCAQPPMPTCTAQPTQASPHPNSPSLDDNLSPTFIVDAITMKLSSMMQSLPAGGNRRK